MKRVTCWFASCFSDHRVVAIEALAFTTGQLLPYLLSGEGGLMACPFPPLNPSLLREFPKEILGKVVVGSPRDIPGNPEDTRCAVFRSVSRLACKCVPAKPSTIETAAIALNDTTVH